ncbi:uncharacterized protein LOC141660141 [Apium graveolens]|uniref:uncharacterized protein LOC141660141 n=1 Tax=Apium graveolens TaxID=4045 RepID=UPI003D7B15C0
MASGASTISHLLFADDTYFFFRATSAEAGVMHRILQRYEMISGKMVNYGKSMVSFSSNTTKNDRQVVCRILNISEVNTPRKYLGKVGVAGLKVDISKVYDRLEWPFIEMMMGRFGFPAKWIERVMSCVKTVSYSFLRNGDIFGDIAPHRGIRQGDPISPYLYIMCAEGLSGLIREHEECGLLHGCKIANKAPIQKPGKYLGMPMCVGSKKSEVFGFLTDRVQQRLRGWYNKELSKSGKVTLLSSSAQALPSFWMNMFRITCTICEEIERKMNAFLWGNGRNSKGWKLLKESSPLVFAVMKAKYYPNTSFLDAKVGSNPSYTWRSIMAAIDVIKAGTRKKFAIEGIQMCGVFPGYQILLMEDACRWDVEVLQDIFQSRDVELIMQIPLSTDASAGIMIRNVFDKVSKEQCVQLGMVCWSLWNRRNNWVWNKVNGSAIGVMAAVSNLLRDWREAQTMVANGHHADGTRQWK